MPYFVFFVKSFFVYLRWCLVTFQKLLSKEILCCCPEIFSSILESKKAPKICLILAWSVSSQESNCFMLTVRSLESPVGQNEIALYRIAVDPSRDFGFILWPDAEKANFCRAHYVGVGSEKIFFDQVCSVGYLPFCDDVNQ